MLCSVALSSNIRILCLILKVIGRSTAKVYRDNTDAQVSEEDKQR
jgi:hypothetical protein